MLEDIITGKDDISYVLVFKLSRFGRNAADVLKSLQLMQTYGVNLISVDDGIDSSKDAGKLVITILSAVAEIERENILVQTMEGRKQKAREGKWNGGIAPYGYRVEKGILQLVEDEATVIRKIFDLYVNTGKGANSIAKELQLLGISKKIKKNGPNPLFSAHLIRKIIENPVYFGKISYGRRKTEPIKGKPGQYRLVKQDDFILVDGLHEAIVDHETWEKAQQKRLINAKKYEFIHSGKESRIHLLSGLLRCPNCNGPMYGNKSRKKKADGTNYKDYFYYSCKHRLEINGKFCNYRKQIHEEIIDNAVAHVISKLISRPKFANEMEQRIQVKTNTDEIDNEIEQYRKQLGLFIGTKRSLEKQIDSMDYEDKHYDRKFSDLDDRLNRVYDNIYDVEVRIEECRDRKRIIESEKLTAENVYKTLIHFDKLYAVMEDIDKRAFLTSLIDYVQIHKEKQSNGQWLKQIAFKLPLIEENMKISLDNGYHVETVVLITRTKE